MSFFANRLDSGLYNRFNFIKESAPIYAPRNNQVQNNFNNLFQFNNLFNIEATQYQPNRTLWGNSPSEPVQYFVIGSPSVEETAVVDDNKAEVPADVIEDPSYEPIQENPFNLIIGPGVHIFEPSIIQPYGPGPHIRPLNPFILQPNGPGPHIPVIAPVPYDTTMSLEKLFEMVNVNNDNELTADEVIKAYKETDDENLKEILSYFTDGETVTDAFKMACGGRSGIDGYENGNRGLTLNTDDVGLITKNGEVSLDMLKLLERASMFSELYLSNQNIVALAGPSSSEEAKERANAWGEAMLDYSKSDETRFSENLNSLLVKDIYDSYRGMMGCPPILADVSEGLVYHSIRGQYGQGIRGDLFNGVYNGLLIEDGKVVGFADLENTPYLVDPNISFS